MSDAGILAPLDDRHRDVLLALALDGTRAVSRTHWQETARDAGIRDDAGRQLHGPAFKAIVDALERAGAASLDQRGEYSLPMRWLVPVLEDAHRRGRLRPISEGIAASRTHRWADYGGGLRRALLVSLASGDVDAAARAQSAFTSPRYDHSSARLVDALGVDVPPAWIALLEARHLVDYLRDACRVAFDAARPLGSGVRAAALACDDADILAQVAILDALAGDLPSARAVLDPNGRPQWMRGAKALVALCDGDHAAARELFAAAALGSRGQRVELPAYLAVFDILLAATSDVAAELASVPARVDKAKRHLAPFRAATIALLQLASFRRTERKESLAKAGDHWLDALVVALSAAWTGERLQQREELRAFGEGARANGLLWVAHEIEAVLGSREESVLFRLLGTKESWELALEALGKAVSDGEAPAPGRRRGAAGAQVWWTVSVHPRSRWVDLDAYLVTSSSSKGTKLAVERTLVDEELPLDAHDRRVVDAVRASRGQSYIGLPCSVLRALVGHPRVRDLAGGHLRVEAGEPKLHVERSKDGAKVRAVPAHFDESGVAVEREGADRLVVYTRTPLLTRVLRALPPEGLEVPRSGLGRLSEMLGTLSGAIGVDGAGTLAKETRDGDPRIHVQLFRAGQAMRARLRVVPGGTSGPALRPGTPPEETPVPTERGLVLVRRDLAEERARLARLLERCPILDGLPQDGDDRVARDLEMCLELLLELREAESEVAVDWLEGQPLRVPTIASGAKVRVRVAGDADWLSITGGLRIDEARVVEMNELLSAASRAVGRFVPIGESEFVVLTEQVRAKLASLARLSQLGKDGRVPGALLQAVDAIGDGLDFSFSDTLEKRREALERARTLEVRAPRGLEAELRDYQRDGFAFLARRTEAGLGACLADDMGLGKTIQALALLLHRMRKGPALVVAPTSVCRNWEAEAVRFAPTLRVMRFGDGDRESCVASAKPGDLVIASYGLLAAEEELLASRTWATVVYDEAHALKNSGTRRWAAARRLKTEATVALTGTPVENHVAELHALFELLVPGMLGSRGTFDAMLGRSIAEGDREAAAILRQIVRPFVLRRTKTQVLPELPPKTEVLHVVRPTAEHRAFYEAVRRRAVEKMDAARRAPGAKRGQARIDLLAELMRLRRAAIDPRLVAGEQAPRGAKLEVLVELLAQLREEGRRALVFSQFLEVLDLARAALEGKGIACARLDGTMTAAARAEAVSGFQDGQGDVFLMSLKAGGVGMNLTAADVVVLLDPWWNPAVEDQAAGRAHRYGQTRPVTVARIVTEGTIEERVLSLHEKKRRLYEELVADADGAGSVDIEAIAALLEDGGAGISVASASS